jgi:hypothetical protein
MARHKSKDFLLLRYEDMVSGTAAELTRVAAFLSRDTTPESVRQAVERSSADEMRKLEDKNATASVTRNMRKDIPFVRAAGSGGWKQGLPEHCVAALETAWAPLMMWLGYEPSLVKASEPRTLVPGVSVAPPGVPAQ